MLSLDSMFLTNTVIKILQKRKEIVCCVKLNTEISTRHSKPLHCITYLYKDRNSERTFPVLDTPIKVATMMEALQFSLNAPLLTHF